MCIRDRFYTNENVGSGELDLPEQQMHTTSYWLTVPAGVMALLPYASDDRRDGVVGLAFALKQIAQLLLMCDGHDIGISIDTGDADGFAGAAALGKAFDSLLFGVMPFDAVTFTSAGFALVAVGLLAASVPAARAARIDPAGALRQE